MHKFLAGYLRLELPVFHIGYFKHVLQILSCICKKCSAVLLEDGEARRHLRSFRSGRLERLGRAALFKQILDRCKRTKVCDKCGAYNGTVKCVFTLHLEIETCACQNARC